MHRLIDLKIPLLTAIALIALVTVFACTTGTEEPTATEEAVAKISSENMSCPDLEPLPDSGNVPLGPPPGMPYIFTGTAYVDGDPAPEGELLYVKLTASRSKEVRILPDGKYRDIIHGPVHPPDRDVPFVFCLGNPEGKTVMSEESVEYEDKGTFHEIEMDLNFPVLPSELSSQ